MTTSRPSAVLRTSSSKPSAPCSRALRKLGTVFSNNSAAPRCPKLSTLVTIVYRHRAPSEAWTLAANVYVTFAADSKSPVSPFEAGICLRHFAKGTFCLREDVCVSGWSFQCARNRSKKIANVAHSENRNCIGPRFVRKQVRDAGSGMAPRRGTRRETRFPSTPKPPPVQVYIVRVQAQRGQQLLRECRT